MVEQGFKTIEMQALPRKDNAPIFMRIVVPYDAKDTVMQSSFWPGGIRIRGWYFLRNS